jgi:hypothetical protein
MSVESQRFFAPKKHAPSSVARTLLALRGSGWKSLACAPLIAQQGTRWQTHFSHAEKTTCDGGFETILHGLLKSSSATSLRTSATNNAPSCLIDILFD